MTVSPEARELATKAMYEARTQGAYVTPWEAMPSDRKWFWYEAFDKVLPIILADLEGREPIGDRITVRKAHINRLVHAVRRLEEQG